MGMVCRPLDEFKAFVKDEGFDLNEAEAQAVFDEMYEMDLSEEELDAVSGGAEWCVSYDNSKEHRGWGRRK